MGIAYPRKYNTTNKFYNKLSRTNISQTTVCLICQEQKEEPLTCPSQSKRKDVGSGYRSLAESLIRFNELGQLPIQLKRLDEGNRIEMTMVANDAKYHQSCRLQYNIYLDALTELTPWFFALDHTNYA